MTAPADTLVERLEAFPLFCSTDGGVHWLKGAIAKEPLCLEAAARIRTLESAVTLAVDYLEMPIKPFIKKHGAFKPGEGDTLAARLCIALKESK